MWEYQQVEHMSLSNYLFHVRRRPLGMSGTYEMHKMNIYMQT